MLSKRYENMIKLRPNSILQFPTAFWPVCTRNNTFLRILGQGKSNNELAEARGEISQTVSYTVTNLTKKFFALNVSECSPHKYSRKR